MTSQPDLKLEVDRIRPELERLKGLLKQAHPKKLDRAFRITLRNLLREVANLLDPERDREDRDDNALGKASWHLGYEIDMLFSLAAWLYKNATPGELTTKACLESFLVHARILDEFLYSPPKRVLADTQLARDYLTEWEKQRPDRPDDFKHAMRLRSLPGQATFQGDEQGIDLKEYINKEIVHLTYTRSEREVQSWLFMRIAHLMWEPIKNFSEVVAREEVCDHFRQSIAKHTQGLHVNCPE